jgi:hypothetical protein
MGIRLNVEEVEFLRDLIGAAVVQSLYQAQASTDRPRGITGTAALIDGADCYVEPDDDLDSLIQGTLYSSGVSVGDSVLLLQLPPSGAFVLGPQAT